MLSIFMPAHDLPGTGAQQLTLLGGNELHRRPCSIPASLGAELFGSLAKLAC